MLWCDTCGGLISRYPSRATGRAMCRDCRIDAADPPESPVKVILACSKDWVPESTVTAENIEEDIMGRDVLTFRCPQCGESHRSFRIG